MAYQFELKEIEHVGFIEDDVYRETARAISATHYLLSIYMVMDKDEEVGMCLVRQDKKGVIEIYFLGRHQDMWHVIQIAKELLGQPHYTPLLN